MRTVLGRMVKAGFYIIGVGCGQANRSLPLSPSSPLSPQLSRTIVPLVQVQYVSDKLGQLLSFKPDISAKCGWIVAQQVTDLIDLRQLLERVIFCMDTFGSLGGCYGLQTASEVRSDLSFEIIDLNYLHIHVHIAYVALTF